MCGLCALAALTVWKMSTPPSTFTLAISVIQVMNTPLRDMPSLESAIISYGYQRYCKTIFFKLNQMQMAVAPNNVPRSYCLHFTSQFSHYLQNSLTRTWPSEVPWHPSACSPLPPSSWAWSPLEDDPPLARIGSGTESLLGRVPSSGKRIIIVTSLVAGLWMDYTYVRTCNKALQLNSPCSCQQPAKQSSPSQAWE